MKDKPLFLTSILFLLFFFRVPSVIYDLRDSVLEELATTPPGLRTAGFLVYRDKQRLTAAKETSNRGGNMTVLLLGMAMNSWDRRPASITWRISLSPSASTAWRLSLWQGVQEARFPSRLPPPRLSHPWQDLYGADLSLKLLVTQRRIRPDPRGIPSRSTKRPGRLVH
jgi:hypothetical protein